MSRKNGKDFGLCKLKYLDEPRVGTVDGAVAGGALDGVLYSVIFVDGRYEGFQVYPCVEMPYTEIKADMREMALRRLKDAAFLCADRLSWEDVEIAVLEDFEEASADDRKYVIALIRQCFSRILREAS